MSPPLFIDSHCHLQAEVFTEIFDDVSTQMQRLAIHAVCNATATDDWNEVLSLSQNNDHISAALGIHPWYIPEEYEEKIAKLYDLKDSICAIGEAGLDGKYSSVSIAKQQRCFELQLKAASELAVPVITHCIAAFDELIASIKRIKPKVPLIIHAFNGSAELAESLAKFGCLFSVGGTVTYEYSKKREKMLRYIYREQLMMLETDAPDIPPAGTEFPNKPERIVEIADAAAEYLEVPPETLARSCTALASEVFGIITNHN